MKNGSAALSLLNKVCNSIFYRMTSNTDSWPVEKELEESYFAVDTRYQIKQAILYTESDTCGV
jgi:hypothetical protein